MFAFLDDIDHKAKLAKQEYKPPSDEYKFNNEEFEVALGASDLEDQDDKRVVKADSSDEQTGFDSDGNELEISKPGVVPTDYDEQEEDSNISLSEEDQQEVSEDEEGEDELSQDEDEEGESELSENEEGEN